MLFSFATVLNSLAALRVQDFVVSFFDFLIPMFHTPQTDLALRKKHLQEIGAALLQCAASITE